MSEDENKELSHPSTRLIPPSSWNKFHPWPPLGGLRHLIFHADTNGFRIAIKRVGRRVLIDEKKFFEFVEEKNKTKKVL